MKIAAISDTHLGFKYGSPRYRDTIEQAEEAFRKAIQRGAELILLTGDLFNIQRPPLEVWKEAIRILRIPKEVSSNLSCTEAKENFAGIPVVAVHGNHEFLSRGSTNVFHVLHEAGFLVYLHCSKVIFEGPDGKVAIHGMSYVNESRALDVLKYWKPRPVENAINILILHQSIGPFVFQKGEQARIQLSDLPPGFDLYVCGHVHLRNETRVRGKPLLFPGSTVRTQLLETEKEKGFYLIDISSSKISYEFVELETVRDFYYEKVAFSEAQRDEINKTIKDVVENILSKPRKNPRKSPLIKIKLLGTVARGLSLSDLDFRPIIDEFSGRALLEIDKSSLVPRSLGEKAEVIRELKSSRLSLREKTMRLLEAYLQKLTTSMPLSLNELYHLLSEEEDPEVKIDKIIEERLGS